MYLRVVTTLLLGVSAAIAARLWWPAGTPPPPSVPVSPTALPAAPPPAADGGLTPFGVWPYDPVSPDPVLEKPVGRVTIRATGMADALRQFGQQAGVSVVWTTDRLPGGPGDAFEFDLHDMTVGTALAQMLAGGIFEPPVSTRGGVAVLAPAVPLVRLYDVRGLLAPAAAGPVSAATGPAPTPMPADANPDADGGSGPDPVRQERVGRLVTLVETAAGAGRRWRDGEVEARDTVTEFDGVLVVLQTPEGHRAIARLLDALRAAAAGRR